MRLFLVLLLILSMNCFAQEAEKEAVLTLINLQRASLGIGAVERDLQLEGVIQSYTEEMANGSRPFGHGGSGERCKKSRELVGGANLCGEIIAWGHKTPESVQAGWTNSLGHYKVMSNSRYNLAGVAIAVTKTGRIYWSVLFLER